MIKTILWTLLILLVPTFLAGQEESPAVPFKMPIPEGWRTETIPFPLSFAPQLPYKGLEELRFAGGMLDEDSEEYWTYAFVWWIPVETVIHVDSLESHIEVYFKGLANTVAESREFDPGTPRFKADLRELNRRRGRNLRFGGSVETYDAFVSRKPLTLQVKAEVIACKDQEMLAVFFALSPQPSSHTVWDILDGIRRGFECSP